MTRPGTWWLSTAALLLVAAAPLSNAQSPPPVAREFRAAWVASVSNIDWPSKPGLSARAQQAELIAILDRAVELHLNAIILHVRTAADALYDSRLEPWSEYLTGQQGLAPEPAYDPLAFAVREAHARGIELHAWFNPFRAFHPSSKTPDTALTHVTRTGIVSAPRYGTHRWMDPGDPRVRAHSLAVIMDVVKRYDIDGVHIDDYFYPYRETDPVTKKEIPFPDDSSWAAYQRGGGLLARDDWRRDNVDVFVRDMYRAVRGARKPAVKVGISPFGMWRPGYPEKICCFDPYVQLYADSRKWLQNGWLDYWVPQLYWQSDTVSRSYPALLAWWVSQNTKQRHMWPGLFTSKAGGPWLRPGEAWGAGEITRQIELTRRQPGATGEVHFSMRSLMDERADSLAHRLATDSYREPALVPSTRWLDSVPPRVPAARIAKDVQTGGRRLLLSPAAGEPVWLWTVQELRDGRWTTRILPAEQRSTAITRNGREREPEAVWVSAVDRLGNQSAVVRAR
ncbi:MAG: family 10 glycosylhydrolase [Polaromonas sp.]|nr:family 10 glycosylhydrolase [Gemmatimonadaceae bacterium]